MNSSRIYTNFLWAHTVSMSATVTLEDAAAEVAKLYAESREISLSKAASEIVLQHGLRESQLQQSDQAIATDLEEDRSRIKYVDGFPEFDIPQGRTITNEEIRAALAEDF